MASMTKYKAGGEYGNSLKDFMLMPELIPGDMPSYEACKVVYTYHPLGQKMAETPIVLAQSQERDIAVPGAPSTAIKAYGEEFKGLGAKHAIRATKTFSRVYGVATCGIIAEGVPADRPLIPKQLRDLRIAFNIWDPLNTSGSLVLNQNPNAIDFLKPSDQGVAVSGEKYHPSRTFTVFNERPVYLQWTPGAFGFVGRSVYQRAWFPLKSYLKTMITDDMVATKAGVLVAKIKMPGSIADNIMGTAFGYKREVVKEAEVGNVINVTPEESIESLNLQNLQAPMEMARANILKNCALAGDMPAVMLNEETYVEGFSEGTEDARRVSRFIDMMREEMDPHYAWFDEIAMHRAWGPDYYKTVQAKYPNVFGRISYTSAFYAWKNSFSATWPNYIAEPESEKIKREEVVLNSAIAAVQTLMPISDPSNQATMAAWLSDTINDQSSLFKTPLEYDVAALESHLEEQKEQADEQQKQLSQSGGNGDGDSGGGGGGGGGGGDGDGAFPKQTMPKPKKISADSMDDKVSHALTRLHDSINRLPDGSKARRDTMAMIDGLAKRSGVRA